MLGTFKVRSARKRVVIRGTPRSRHHWSHREIHRTPDCTARRCVALWYRLWAPCGEHLVRVHDSVRVMDQLVQMVQGEPHELASYLPRSAVAADCA